MTRILGFAERAAWTAGAVLIVGVAGVRMWGDRSAAREVATFTAAYRAPATEPRPDMDLWSPIRIKAWEETFARERPVALAVLRIPKIKLEVPVLEGTDDWTLNRAVGLIEETARPGATGNVGIAGHRDGFFRGLKDLVVGDRLDVDLGSQLLRYRVSDIWIVKPEDVWVIDPTTSPAVTLVTCYPFYFVGSAPERYIVRAVPASQ